jgi:hypothetical protein
MNSNSCKYTIYSSASHLFPSQSKSAPRETQSDTNANVNIPLSDPPLPLRISNPPPRNGPLINVEHRRGDSGPSTRPAAFPVHRRHDLFPTAPCSRQRPLSSPKTSPRRPAWRPKSRDPESHYPISEVVARSPRDRGLRALDHECPAQ